MITLASRSAPVCVGTESGGLLAASIGETATTRFSSSTHGLCALVRPAYLLTTAGTRHDSVPRGGFPFRGLLLQLWVRHETVPDDGLKRLGVRRDVGGIDGRDHDHVIAELSGVAT